MEKLICRLFVSSIYYIFSMKPRLVSVFIFSFLMPVSDHFFQLEPGEQSVMKASGQPGRPDLLIWVSLRLLSCLASFCIR